MNEKAVTRHYDSLTPEERFRLILAAGGRGDTAERDRLVKAGERITLSMPDHSPYAQAFDELALLVFIELLEEAAGYFDAFHRADDARDLFGDNEAAEEEGDHETDEEEPAATADAERAEDEDRPVWQRSLDIALAAGCVLRTKADGWKLFCERLNVPPFLLWDKLPGLNRLKRALDLTEKAALTPEGFLRWLNRIRPAGEPERTEIALSAEEFADAAAKLFQDRVEWWGGD
jgi:hypothetical protein